METTATTGRTHWLSRPWIGLAQIGFCLLALIVSVYLPPQGGAWRRFAQVFAAMLVAMMMMLIPVSFWREPRHSRRWAIAATLFGLLGLFAPFGYMKETDDWTCSYAGTKVVVGDELTPDGARYMSQHPDMTCKDVIWNHAGAVDEIWTKASIDRRRNLLDVIRMVMPALAGCFLMAVRQVVYVGSRSPGSAVHGKTPSVDRLRVHVFISYRRDDTAGIVDRLYDRLVERLEPDCVFRDIQSIGAGEDFLTAVQTAMAKCDVLLAVIGPQWLDVKDHKGARRLDNPKDLVRIEIETALQRRVHIIPLLYKASPPEREGLPDTLSALSTLNGLWIRDDPDFDADVERLVAAIGGKGRATTTPVQV